MGIRGRRIDRARIDRLLKKWRESGQSARVFGEHHGVSLSTLYRWKRNYGTGDSAAESSTEQRGFVPVVIRPEQRSRPAAAIGFIVEVERGFRVEVRPGFDDGELRRLFEVIGGMAC